MTRVTLETIGRKLVAQRGERGIRETAKEIGISPATLSRVERGHLPDLQTFKRICEWLAVDPGVVLGTKSPPMKDRPPLAVHFKKSHTVTEQTAKDLAQLILAAQRAMAVTQGEEKS